MMKILNSRYAMYFNKRHRLVGPFPPNLPLNDQIPLQSGSPQKDFYHVIAHEQAKRALEIAAQMNSKRCLQMWLHKQQAIARET